MKTFSRLWKTFQSYEMGFNIMKKSFLGMTKRWLLQNFVFILVGVVFITWVMKKSAVFSWWWVASGAGYLRVWVTMLRHSHTNILLHLHKNWTLLWILSKNLGAQCLSFRVTFWTPTNLYHPGIRRGHCRYKLVPAKSRPWRSPPAPAPCPRTAPRGLL